MGTLKRSAIIAVMGAMLLGGALFAWQREETAARSGFASLEELRAAYARVAPGMPVARLVGLGFDRTRPGAETLSYLGTLELFMPRNSGEFDRLDPAILSCLAVGDRCEAYVFRLDGNAGVFDIVARAAVPGEGRIVFLVKSGRVAWKEMVGGRS